MAEHQIVDLAVAGSNPASHPIPLLRLWILVERQVEAPIVASQKISSGVLEFDFTKVGERLLSAERVGRHIGNRRERVQKASLVVAAQPSKQRRKCLTREPPALGFGKDHPAGLINKLVPPCLFPETNFADH